MSFEKPKMPACPPTSVSDYRTLAAKRLPRQIFHFIDSGANEEITIRRNRTDFDSIVFNKKILRGASKPNVEATVFGQRLSFPLVLAPVGFAGLFSQRGEVQGALAAEQAGIPFCLSTLSICSMEEVAAHTTSPFWFQFYMLKDKGLCKELLDRSFRAGCTVLMFTVDVPVVGVRQRDRKNGMIYHDTTLEGKLALFWQFFKHQHWFWHVFIKGKPLNLGNFARIVPPAVTKFSKIREWVQESMNDHMTWKDLEWVLENWPGKVAVKGVLDADDARKCADMGAHGIVVSNHAGRHLDSTPSAISRLPCIADAIGGRLEILMDGGVYSGIEIVKALALGARACMIGRPWAYALGAGGGKGISDFINMMQQELTVAMTHLGIPSIGAIDRNLVSMR